MKLPILLTALLLFASYLFSKYKGKREAANYIENDIQYGPFTVRVTAEKGMDKATNARYTILHDGKPVVFPVKSVDRDGLPFLWKVYPLPGAPDPTLVAGSDKSYLVFLKNGSPCVETLFERSNDLNTFQFLDAENGRPGEFSNIFTSTEIADLTTLNSLGPGRFLMAGRQTLLDAQTRKIWRINLDNEMFENYSPSSQRGALALSPDQKTVVFWAEFQSWNTENENLPDSEHALVAYNFEKNNGYAVKFDDTETRVTNIEGIDFQWFETYFEWKKSPDGEILQLRKLEKLPNWTGRYDPKDNYYTLYPVKPDILPVFLDFVLAQMGWSKDNILKDETHEYTGHCLDLGSGTVKLDIKFREDDRALTFSKHLYDEKTPEYEALVKKIAAAFDAELRSGKHQAHFGRAINQTKRIHGMEY